MPRQKSGKINHMTLNQTFGQLAACFMNLPHCFLPSEPTTCRACTGKSSQVGTLRCQQATQTTSTWLSNNFCKWTRQWGLIANKFWQRDKLKTTLVKLWSEWILVMNMKLTYLEQSSYQETLAKYSKSSLNNSINALNVTTLNLADFLLPEKILDLLVPTHSNNKWHHLPLSKRFRNRNQRTLKETQATKTRIQETTATECATLLKATQVPQTKKTLFYLR